MADYNAYNTDWAAAVQAGANILGSTAQMIYQGEADSDNRKLYRETRDMQRQWALEDYEKVLRDSSPAEQVRRLKEAGLNPNLVYGSGNIQTGVTSAPTMNMPTPPYKQRGLDLDLSVVNALGNILDLQLKKAEIKKIEADTNKTTSETTGIDLQNEIDSSTKHLSIAIKGAEYHKILRETSKIDNDIWQSTLKTNSDISLSNEQQYTLIQGRLYQVLDYDLRLWELGENIKAQIKHLANEATNAKANLQNAAANFLKAATERDLAAPEIASRWIDYNVKKLEESFKGNDYYINKQANEELIRDLDTKLKYKKYLKEGDSGVFDEFLDAFGTFFSPSKIKL